MAPGGAPAEAAGAQLTHWLRHRRSAVKRTAARHMGSSHPASMAGGDKYGNSGVALSVRPVGWLADWLQRRCHRRRRQTDGTEAATAAGAPCCGDDAEAVLVDTLATVHSSDVGRLADWSRVGLVERGLRAPRCAITALVGRPTRGFSGHRPTLAGECWPPAAHSAATEQPHASCRHHRSPHGVTSKAGFVGGRPPSWGLRRGRRLRFPAASLEAAGGSEAAQPQPGLGLWIALVPTPPPVPSLLIPLGSSPHCSARLPLLIPHDVCFVATRLRMGT